MSDKRILKVKFGSDEKHVFEYEVSKDVERTVVDELSFKSKEKALPAFYEAMQDLSEHVCEICELPKEMASEIKVIGVSFSYEEKSDVMGAVITATRTLKHSNSPMLINTPFKPSDFYNEDEAATKDPALLLSQECVEALHTMEDEAIRYIDGERLQTDLFAGKSEQSGEMASKLSESELEAERLRKLKKDKTSGTADGGENHEMTIVNPDEAGNEGESESDAFKPTRTGRKINKGLAKAAKEFKDNMHKVIKDSNGGITGMTISHGDNQVTIQ